MKILVTGVKGQLGYDVVKELDKRGHESIGVDREEMDLTSSEQIKKYIENINPEAIIHCGAYTSVDLAEENEKLCRRVNAIATKEIAEYAKKIDIPMIYISTDYIFDGKKDGVYDENDVANPINVYGKTKYEGELYVREILEKYYIVRISWGFGNNGNNFIDTMLRLSKDRESLNVINDQIGSPTYTKDLAPLLVDMIETDKYGTYHATNEGFCSWYDFAKEIFKYQSSNISVRAIAASEYYTKAKRPINSKMNKSKLTENGFKLLRSWEKAVQDYILIQHELHNG